MIDREKVIKGLEDAEIMLTQAVDRGGEMAAIGAFKCLNRVTDALALLKEPEAVEPDTDSEGTCTCGNCGETVGYYPDGCNTPQKLCKFCPTCGKLVKWE